MGFNFLTCSARGPIFFDLGGGRNLHRACLSRGGSISCLSRGGPVYPEAGLSILRRVYASSQSIPRRTYLSRGGPIHPEVGLCIQRRAYASGLSIPKRSYLARGGLSTRRRGCPLRGSCKKVPRIMCDTVPCVTRGSLFHKTIQVQDQTLGVYLDLIFFERFQRVNPCSVKAGYLCRGGTIGRGGDSRR